MTFHAELTEATRDEQQALLEIPFVQAAMTGRLTREAYVAFLTQAYHHVKHTVPLLMATGAALDDSREWLRDAIAEYIREELGHQEWILDDITACGGDADAARHGRPSAETEFMVAYAYDVVRRGNPVGFFGMVHVLEGTSVRGASQAADHLAVALKLPASAFTYLSSHGALDLDHVEYFAGLMDRLDDPADRRAVVHRAKRFFRLYGDMFRELGRHLSPIHNEEVTCR